MKNELHIDCTAMFVTFTICTLVTDVETYQNLRRSFTTGGFDHCSEYIFADNTGCSTWLPFAFMKECAKRGSGQYFIFVHQDILLINEGVKHLLFQLESLSRLDNSWGIAGNAGVTQAFTYAMRITDPHGANITVGELPERVRALDENFIVVRAEAIQLVPDKDYGFHHFASILVNILSGHHYSAYVIDFHIEHLSPGRMNLEFYSEALKWSRWLRSNKYFHFIVTGSCAIIDGREFGLVTLVRSEVLYRRITSRLAVILHKWMTRKL
jgi:hypothetical protein